MDAASKKQKRFRFGVAAFLFFVACIAGLLYGYRIGVLRALADQEVPLRSVQVYYVSDLIKSKEARADSIANEADFDSVVKLVNAVVAPGIDPSEADEAAARPYPEKQALIVTATRDEHEQVATILEAVRSLESHPQTVSRDSSEQNEQ